MIDALASAPLVQALALALLHFVWQGAALGLLLWIVLKVLGRGAARLRYAAACAALVLAAALPALTAARLMNEQGEMAGPAVSFNEVAAQCPADEGGAALTTPLRRPPPPLRAYIAVALLGAWLLAATLRLARVGVGLYRVRALLAACAPLEGAVARRARRLARQMGLSRLPRLLCTDRIDVPMAVGWLRPAVLIPLSAISSLSPAHLDALLAHELSHVRRHDYLVNLLQEVVLSLLFFHPAAHFIARSIREAREHAADDDAARWVAPAALARALYTLESSRNRSPGLALGAHGGDLVTRIERLLKPSTGERSPRRAALSALAAGGALLLAAALGSCAGGAADTAPASGSAAEAETAEVRIRWLPPALSPYKGLFEGAAQRHGVDADALAIIALLESSGDPDARSPAGAVGLMQIMPRTGAEIAKERGFNDFEPDRLSDPSINVDYGAWYFARQAHDFAEGEGASAKVALASAAYNAGPRAVRAYLAKEKALPEETQRYQALVVGMYEERGAERSATFEAWRARVGERLAASAQAPVAGARVSSAFNAAAGHTGVDLAAPAGTAVVAPLDGTVVATERDDRRGLVLVVRHRAGVESRYHHLDSVAVKAGDRVAKGDTIAAVGSSGVSTGPHVHFEVRDLGTPIDPAPLLANQ